MSPRTNSRFEVLVVDDDPSVLATYQRLLKRCGYRTTVAADPLRVLDGETPIDDVDLLLLDYKMPGMDGLSLLAELRLRECRARCILLSAYLNDDVRCQARILGVDRVLEKPIDSARLKQAIRQLLPLTAERQAKIAG